MPSGPLFLHNRESTVLEICDILSNFDGRGRTREFEQFLWERGHVFKSLLKKRFIFFFLWFDFDRRMRGRTQVNRGGACLFLSEVSVGKDSDGFYFNGLSLQ